MPEGVINRRPGIAPWVAIIFAASAVPLHYLSANLGKVPVIEAVQTWAALAVAGIVLALLLRAARLTAAQASLIAAGGLILVFAEESFRSVVLSIGLDLPYVAAPLGVVGLFLLLAVAVIYFRRPAEVIVTFVAAALCVTSASACYTLYQRNAALEAKWSRLKLLPVPALSVGESGTPNIYYILLDGLGRFDTLSARYGIATASYKNRLESLGFKIADQSYANYPQTLLSLNAALGMQYLDAFSEAAGSSKEDQQDRGLLRYGLIHNPVSAALKRIGYKTVMIPTGYAATDLRHFDHRHFAWWLPGEFGHQLIARSIPGSKLQWVASLQLDAHRQHLRNLFDNLVRISDDRESAKFVFAHLLAPHPPFVFSASGAHRVPVGGKFRLSDGSHLVRDDNRTHYQEGYAAQAAWVLERAIQTAQQVLRNDRDAVIVLQGDHGPGSELRWESPEKSDLEERFAIFSAYRLPEHATRTLYSEISPVNTFRLILSELFAAKLALLPDNSYFARFSRPFVYDDVSRKVGNQREATAK